MSDDRSPQSTGISSEGASAVPSSALLWILVALGLAQLAWAGFQWQELITHRRGGDAFCGFAALGDCAAVWDSPFALGVRVWTGLPVAAWGVVWGAAAAMLPAVGLWRRSAGRSVEPFWSASVVAALAGMAVVVVLVAASAQFGSFCANCVLTYALVLVYAAASIRSALRSGRLELGRGVVAAVAPVVLGYLIVLYPALQTPSKAPLLAQLPATPQPSATSEPDVGSAEATAFDVDAVLMQRISELPPDAKQSLSNGLEEFRRSPDVAMRPARGLIGPPTAKVQLTEFADLLCSHCADLHHTLTVLRQALPPEVFRIEPRYFPLDGRCNPMLGPREGPETSCIAAKVMICAAGTPRAFDLSTRLFERQRQLTPDLVFELAAPLVEGVDLRSCVASPETAEALSEDIEWAAEHKIQGTPLVLIDGRRVPSNGQVLFALLLAGGDPDHPAFAQLPAPQIRPASG